jgi:hypothetical protein
MRKMGIEHGCDAANQEFRAVADRKPIVGHRHGAVAMRLSIRPTLFGRGGYAIVGNIRRLPAALPSIYRQLAR